MAKHVWIKWAVGLSSAVFFSGFVGYLGQTGQVEGTVPVDAGNGQERLNDAVEQQWRDAPEYFNYDSNPDAAGSDGSAWTDSGADQGGGEWSDGGGLSDQGQGQGVGRIRSHAS
ncbi:hypothetical protein [Paenibacillus gansuensis]|uniref:Uncharacterized protein n=1 Tax=Paenibacillus gansuensis TaxID=306542 RepID=A0ABW5PGJ3_9BACL